MSQYFSPEALETTVCIALFAVALLWAIPPDAKDTPRVVLFLSRLAKRLTCILLKAVAYLLLVVTAACALAAVVPFTLFLALAYMLAVAFGAKK